MVTEARCEQFELAFQMFDKLNSEPDIFLSPESNLCSNFLNVSKELYDFISDINKNNQNQNYLKELLVDGFDNEQVWQQIQLCNNHSIKQYRKAINQLNEKSKFNIQPSVSKKSSETIKKTKGKTTDPEKDGCLTGEEDSNGDLQHENDDENSDNYDDDAAKLVKSKVYKSTVFDDGFFKLGEMQEFLDKQDQIEEQLEVGKTENDPEDDIDFFNDELSDEEISKRDKEAKYKDFFDGPSKRKEVKTPNKKKVLEESFGIDDEEMEEDEEEEEEEEEEQQLKNSNDGSVAEDKSNENDKEPKSSFEKSQNIIAENIKRLEESNLKKKEWQLQGEASAKQRPLNSLLEEHVTFDHTSVGAPVITEETTETLEDIIKQRVKDEAWDDVKRKQKPVTQPFEYKKAPELNQEKSKVSLAEVYEKEYLKQTEENQEEKENEDHVAINNMMNKLFAQLDALSNFHFTPKPPRPEIKIITNVPSLRMEEITPITMSEASQLAPEEIFDKKSRDIKGDGEKTDTDRKHERRQKKIKKKFAAKDKERKDKLKVQSGKVDKSSKKEAIAQLKKGVRNTIVNEKNSAKSVKSSSEFFNRLQTEIKDGISKLKNKSKTKESKTKKTVQFLKL